MSVGMGVRSQPSPRACACKRSVCRHSSAARRPCASTVPVCTGIQPPRLPLRLCKPTHTQSPSQPVATWAGRHPGGSTTLSRRVAAGGACPCVAGAVRGPLLPSTARSQSGRPAGAMRGPGLQRPRQSSFSLAWGGTLAPHAIPSRSWAEPETSRPPARGEQTTPTTTASKAPDQLPLPPASPSSALLCRRSCTAEI